MKHNLKYVISLAFMLLVTQGAWADDPTVTIIKQLNGAVVTESSPGTVTPEIGDGVCTLTVTPEQGNYVTKDFITVYSVVKGEVAQAPRRSPNLDTDPITVNNKGANTDPTGVTTYEFDMPADGSDVEVTVNFQSYQMYNLFIGETQVTEFNAEDILGDEGSASFNAVTDQATGLTTYTLTLNGAEITTPLYIGLPNLTIDIQGENTITTEETCIQRLNGTPAVTFMSSGDVVGSLILTYTGSDSEAGVNSIGRGEKSGSFSFSNKFAVMLTVYGYVDYTSNTYYFTDGSTKVAKIVPSLGVKVGDMQVYSGNADNVFRWYDEDTPTVVYDAENHKLTLNGANTGAISTSLEELIIELIGNNTLSSGNSSTFQSSTGSEVRMTIQSAGETLASLTLNMDYSSAGNVFVGNNVILNIVAPLTVASGELYENAGNENTVVIGEAYGLTVGGVVVTNANVTDVLGNGKVSFDVETNTLTLNGATINGGIVSDLEDGLIVHLLGSNTIDGGYDPDKGQEGEYAFKNNVQAGAPLTFTTDKDNPGQLLMKKTCLDQNNNAQYYNGWTPYSDYQIPEYANGLDDCQDYQVNKVLIGKTPEITPGEGIYWPGQEFTISGREGVDITYSDNFGHIGATTYSEPFTLTTKGHYKIYARQQVTVDETAFTLGVSVPYFIYDEPTFSLDAGTYTGTQRITLTDLPENLSATIDNYPQVWYYFGENAEDSLQYTSVEQEIELTESAKVSVFILDEDSGKVVKSHSAEAEYVILAQPGLAYNDQNGEAVESAQWTIGSDDQELPVLANENQLAVTFESSEENVATVAADGTVTILGIGKTTITATSEATTEFGAGSASYELTVYKSLSHESITVTVEDAIYTGEPIVDLEVTVMDGETDITDCVMASTEGYDVGQHTVTIIPRDFTDNEGTNYYVGETSATFNIVYRTLEVGEDVTFADGQTWATYYNLEESLNLPEGVNAYVVTDVEGSTVTLQAISYIPEREPVLLEQSETKPSNVAESMEEFDGWNWLCGTDDKTNVSEIEGTVYVLYNGMFVKSTSGTISSHKAYLLMDRPEAPQYLYFNFDTTSVSEKLRVKSEEFATAQWYSLDGRKLSGSPAKKGMYILNGKKMVVK